jgi:DNA-directed RNA polymerase sigma subunit (sigma70/sigma32)
VRDRLDLLEGALRELVVLRYGLAGERPLTFQEAGDRLGVSAGRAVSMERAAIRSALRAAKVSG